MLLMIDVNIYFKQGRTNLALDSIPENTKVVRWFPIYPTAECDYDVQGELKLELFYRVFHCSYLLFRYYLLFISFFFFFCTFYFMVNRF